MEIMKRDQRDEILNNSDSRALLDNVQERFYMLSISIANDSKRN